MPYKGQIASIPLGSEGIETDSPDTGISPTKLFSATNVTLFRNRIEKDFGSKNYNQTALPTAIVAGYDYSPTVVKQKVVVVTKEGRVHGYRNRVAQEEIIATDDAPSFLLTEDFVSIVEGGAELTLRPRKLFIFTGKDPIQVISGDANTRKDIENPAADWTGRNQPVKGILRRSRLVVFQEHTLYISLATDQEDFTTSPLFFPVDPGQGIEIKDIFIFKGRLFILKNPKGLYFLDDSDPNSSNWTVNQVTDEFGATSPGSVVNALNDVFIANNYGTLSSLVATQKLGDVASGDLFNNLNIDDLLVNELSEEGGSARNMLYYAKRKLLYVTYLSRDAIQNNRIVQISFSGRSPQVTIISKDLPLCLFNIRDNKGVDRPYYGAPDGYIRSMSEVDRDVNGIAYTATIDTSDMDFALADPLNAELEKEFEFVEVVYQPTGDFALDIEWRVDGQYIDSSNVKLKGWATLSEIKCAGGDKEGRLSGQSSLSVRIPISGAGRRIAFRLSNGVLGQNFKLERMNVYYNLTENQQDDR
jgi:hypothetical protein